MNAKLRFAQLRADQRELLAKVGKHQKEIEVTLQQLRALNSLLAEVIDQMEVDEYEEAIHHERQEREEVISSLEGLVQNTRQQLREQNQEASYISLTPEQLTTATQGIGRLYELAEKQEGWSEDEASEFFKIQNAVNTSLQYNLSTGMQEAVQQTYEAVKTVQNLRGQDIQANYLQPAVPQPNRELLRQDNVVKYDNKKLNDLL
jgi:hypothetical protein